MDVVRNAPSGKNVRRIGRGLSSKQGGKNTAIFITSPLGVRCHRNPKKKKKLTAGWGWFQKHLVDDEKRKAAAGVKLTIGRGCMQQKFFARESQAMFTNGPHRDLFQTRGAGLAIKKALGSRRTWPAAQTTQR